MEQERCDWLGAHKLCGKFNYVTETCRSMETFHDLNLSYYDCVGIRNNRFNTLSTKENDIAYDKMNEDQNDWNKSCKDTANFNTVSNIIIVSCCVLSFQLISVGYIDIGM